MVWKRPLTNEEPYYQVAVFDHYDYNCEESIYKAQKDLLRPDNGGKLQRGQSLATHHARAEESRRRMVVGTGRLCPTQTSEKSFQETMRRRGRSEPTVAGRSR